MIREKGERLTLGPNTISLRFCASEKYVRRSVAVGRFSFRFGGEFEREGEGEGLRLVVCCLILLLVLLMLMIDL